MPAPLRTFIAADLDDPLLETLHGVQAPLKKLGCDVSWVKPQNMHLTLKFLGDVKAKNIENIKAALSGLCQGQRRILTEVSKVSAFPNIRRPRTIWVGLTDDRGEMNAFFNDMEDTLGQRGIKKETRPFVAHLTLGRVRSNKNIPLLASAIEECFVPKGMKQTIDHVTLYQSTLTSRGPVYQILETFPFKKK